MFRHFFLVATAIALSSCGTTRIINSSTPAELAKISLARNHKTEVTLVDGHRFVVSQLQIKPDSTRWFDGKQFSTVATADIKAITQIQRGKGALQGLGIGLGLGMTIGGIIAYANYKEPENPCDKLDEFSDVDCFTGIVPFLHETGAAMEKLGTIMTGMALGALGGGIVGALIGDAAGSKSNYRFRASMPSPQCRTSGCGRKISYLCNHCHKGWCGDHEAEGNRCRKCQKGFLVKYALAQN
jgi:hypothetical protein